MVNELLELIDTATAKDYPLTFTLTASQPEPSGADGLPRTSVIVSGLNTQTTPAGEVAKVVTTGLLDLVRSTTTRGALTDLWVVSYASPNATFGSGRELFTKDLVRTAKRLLGDTTSALEALMVAVADLHEHLRHIDDPTIVQHVLVNDPYEAARITAMLYHPLVHTDAGLDWPLSHVAPELQGWISDTFEGHVPPDKLAEAIEAFARVGMLAPAGV